MKKILTLILSAAMLYVLCVPAFAWKSNPQDLSTIDIDVGASSWAVNELIEAKNLGLILPLSKNPTFTDRITRLQFAELTVNMVEKALNTTLEAAPADTFFDCTSPAVLKAYKAGIVKGMEDHYFGPSVVTNREQIACFIARAIQYIEAHSNASIAPLSWEVLSGYEDGPQVSSWAAESVTLLVCNSIMQGTGSTTLSPGGPCTVEQSILLLSRVYGKVN